MASAVLLMGLVEVAKLVVVKVRVWCCRDSALHSRTGCDFQELSKVLIGSNSGSDRSNQLVWEKSDLNRLQVIPHRCEQREPNSSLVGLSDKAALWSPHLTMRVCLDG